MAVGGFDFNLKLTGEVNEQTFWTKVTWGTSVVSVAAILAASQAEIFKPGPGLQSFECPARLARDANSLYNYKNAVVDQLILNVINNKMSVITEWHSSKNSTAPHVFNGVLLVFTMLALCVAWVAICVVIFRYLKKICQLRRERSQEEVVNAALRALAQTRAVSSGQLISPSQCHYYQSQPIPYADLPSYAEALHLPPPPMGRPKDEERASSASTNSSTPSSRSSAPPTYELATSRF
ncbi:unnamed protein product [Bursaphelenchus xylophilus]|uniref:(pine wood nematode) hypothetical protein n=1 Tax=Bursaphelenchus xylophilus TaxID=6326 RepID=A0A1I7SE50_BURXY|nr:unnamed protein product [Bursaphelenchus xylophilus]CAG9104189.1 unnamed protein product [Bursaphelenchus xylophilus]